MHHFFRTSVHRHHLVKRVGGSAFGQFDFLALSLRATRHEAEHQLAHDLGDGGVVKIGVQRGRGHFSALQLQQVRLELRLGQRGHAHQKGAEVRAREPDQWGEAREAPKAAHEQAHSVFRLLPTTSTAAAAATSTIANGDRCWQAMPQVPTVCTTLSSSMPFECKPQAEPSTAAATATAASVASGVAAGDGWKTARVWGASGWGASGRRPTR
mmetsp:Transcript_69304/g.136275  ORF Transcript_69304/g.136275 Transcript_69304/m.136275 type:complete len:212 (-) Transcript_69304:50-685(-)